MMCPSILFHKLRFTRWDCREQERPHLLQRQAGPAGQAPDGDRGRRAAQEHALGRRHRPGYRVQLNKKQPRFPNGKRGCPHLDSLRGMYYTVGV